MRSTIQDRLLTGGLARTLGTITQPSSQPSTQPSTQPAANPISGAGSSPSSLQGNEARPRPTAVVFHCSRCGSTLAANAIRLGGGGGGTDDVRRDGAAVVVSEPAAFNSALFHRLTTGDEAADSVIAAIAACYQQVWVGPSQATRASGGGGDRSRGLDGTDAAGQPPLQRPRNFFVKVSSWNVLGIDVLLKLWPGVPWVFIYRDPLEVAVSELERGASGWLEIGRKQPKLMEHILTRSRLLPGAGSSDGAEAGTSPPTSLARAAAARMVQDGDVALITAVLAGYFEAVLDALPAQAASPADPHPHPDAGVASGGACVVNYNDLADGGADLIATLLHRLTGHLPDANDVAAMSEAFGSYSKEVLRFSLFILCTIVAASLLDDAVPPPPTLVDLLFALLVATASDGPLTCYAAILTFRSGRGHQRRPDREG